MFNVIIVPQGAEYQAVKKGLNKLKIAQPKIVAIPIGVKQIEMGLESQNFWQSSPQRVLMMGLCGSLSGRYRVGDAVLYHNCFSQKLQQKLPIDSELNQLIIQKINTLNCQFSIPLVSGLTSDRIISNIEEKRQLGNKFNTQVVDMESFAYLQLLQNHKISLSILRIVSDDLQYNLPNLEPAISNSGKIKTLKMAQLMLQQPIASWRLIQSSLQGLNQLQKITSQIFNDY